jgi:Lrp/AsnC family transcriptional regulator, leucine-responsive regulatory protein
MLEKLLKQKLDRIDIRILAVMETEGRIQNQELAERVGLSPAACSQRLRRLEKAHYIQGYRADINTTLLCKAICVYAVLQLTQQGERCEERTLEALAIIPEVVDCDLIAGENDVLVKFQCASLSEYEKRIGSLLGDATLGIRKIESYIVLRHVKNLHRSNLLYLMDETDGG